MIAVNSPAAKLEVTSSSATTACVTDPVGLAGALHPGGEPAGRTAATGRGRYGAGERADARPFRRAEQVRDRRISTL